jgi:hypothetical protein
LEKKAKKLKKFKKHVGKVKAEFSTSSILKKNLIKIILEKKHVGKHYSKTKIMWGNIVTIHSVFFFKKNYEAKSTKTILEIKRKS